MDPLTAFLGGGGLSLGLSDSGSATSGAGGVNVGGLNAPAFPFASSGAVPDSWMPIAAIAAAVLLVAIVVKR